MHESQMNKRYSVRHISGLKAVGCDLSRLSERRAGWILRQDSRDEFAGPALSDGSGRGNGNSPLAKAFWPFPLFFCSEPCVGADCQLRELSLGIGLSSEHGPNEGSEKSQRDA